jgi:hypothetical protein
LREAGDNPDQLGKSVSHWGALHKEVALAELMAAQQPAAGTVPPALADTTAAGLATAGNQAG